MPERFWQGYGSGVILVEAEAVAVEAEAVAVEAEAIKHYRFQKQTMQIFRHNVNLSTHL